MALRAVRGLKPKERAIWYAFSPLCLARSIWQRRKVKASGERNPASRVSRSASLKGRTKMGRFIPQRINLDYHLVWRCIRPAPVLTLALIHRSAWKGDSPKFAYTKFSEVRYPPASAL